MADYTRDTGSSGTMKITDTGSVVEFWLKASSGTFSYDLPWRYYVNGAWASYRDFRFESGGSWQKLGQITVNSNQTVQFGIGDSGTNGLGGPTTLSAYITRDTEPPAPTVPAISSITSTSVFANTNSNGDGGSPLTRVQIGYGTSSTTHNTYVLASLSNGTVTITGLTPGTTYYFWARMENALGWGPWSARSAGYKTLTVPSAPSTPVLSDVKQNSVAVTFTDNSNGGSAITGRDIGYSTTSSAPTTIVASDGSDVISGLLPGVKYYFWARTKNAVGTSAWSASASATTIPGARVKYNGVWVNAVPYVKYQGVWKVACPWVKIAGLWKETS